MIKTYKKSIVNKKRIRVTRKKRGSLGGGPEDEVPFLLKEKLKEKKLQDLYPLIMSNIPKQSIKNAILMASYKKYITQNKDRKIKAQEKIKKYKEEIEKLKIKKNKIQSQRVTRSQKSKNINPNKEIEKLEEEIKDLERRISALKYRIERNFKLVFRKENNDDDL